MNKFKFYFILLITSITIFSCSKNEDSITVEPPRDYQTQYDADIKIIEDYLKTNYITVVDNPGETSDQDVIIQKLDANHTVSIWDQTKYPLKSRIVLFHNIKYTLYYLELRQGKKDVVTGLGGVSPCNVDGVLTSYRGTYLSESTATATTPSTITVTQFEDAVLPGDFLSLFTTIKGWGEIFPQFKTGSYFSKADGTISYNDFGAGVMFIPSGLGYYTGYSSIPAYSPLVFSFKLYEIQRSDIDNDGIPSYQEDLNGDGYMQFLLATDENPYADDTDHDGIPDFYDVDDDGDNYTTKLEITNAATGLVYPFALIPDCSGNTTDPARVKKHLDKTCH
ncbi:FKBP-type peptidyl-prolyl cis-trans isomerase [Flavobacterium limnophilum]|uniref:FKBP-type peptidyl-prolyl cis-trans isomerase n=1 Tax=Flavobacterium limnophilum TaxID=3003262 RepID=UPI002483025D|nr:FKBP-type peptidylprolyl isomerase [Flavobacterium limnophilum]